jgi:hypothetical protein
VPLVSEKAGVAWLIARCGQGELVGILCRELIRLQNC